MQSCLLFYELIDSVVVRLIRQEPPFLRETHIDTDLVL